ncbi:hypothetical protein [Vibrio alfacsensis]|uniref:hypothetical protein n=1 Tax=Vibrio alfacsensis TaxID=1074311 RepID=UPI0040686C89
MSVESQSDNYVKEYETKVTERMLEKEQYTTRPVMMVMGASEHYNIEIQQHILEGIQSSLSNPMLDGDPFRKNSFVPYELSVVIAGSDYQDGAAEVLSFEDRGVLPVLSTSGEVTFSQASDLAVSLIEKRVRYYRRNNIKCQKPWVILVNSSVGDEYFHESTLKLKSYCEFGQAVLVCINLYGQSSPSYNWLMHLTYLLECSEDFDFSVFNY